MAVIAFRPSHTKKFLYTDVNPYSGDEKEHLEDIESVYGSINTILTTRPGERLFNPEFGTDLEGIIFELMDEDTTLLLYSEIVASVERWEPRITLDHSASGVTPFPTQHLYELALVFSIQGIENQSFTFVRELVA